MPEGAVILSTRCPFVSVSIGLSGCSKSFASSPMLPAAFAKAGAPASDKSSAMDRVCGILMRVL